MNGISLIPIGLLIWRLKTRGQQALFNLEIKKKSGSSLNLDIHHSKVPSSDYKYKSSNISSVEFYHLLSETLESIDKPDGGVNRKGLLLKGFIFFIDSIF